MLAISKLFILVPVYLFFTVGAPAPDLLKNDPLLISGSVGAEKILINETSEAIIETYQQPKIRKSQPHELFKEILDIDIPDKLLFDEAWYYTDKFFFIKDNKVIGIAGVSPNRITTEGFSVNSGIEQALAYYGNIGLIRIKNTKQNIVYYPAIGLIFIDENNDNSIDMYIVIPKGLSSN